MVGCHTCWLCDNISGNTNAMWDKMEYPWVPCLFRKGQLKKLGVELEISC